MRVGITIEGNVTIPAHYHGSVVGITIAFMNFVYWLLPKLGCKEIKSSIVIPTLIINEPNKKHCRVV